MATTTDLVLPSAGSPTVRQLLSTAVRQGISVALGLGLRGRRSAVTTAFQRDVAGVLRREPGVLASSMCMPSRLTLARCLALSGGASPAADAWEDELAVSLALDAARAGVLPSDVTMDGVPLRLVDERARMAFHTGVPARWTFGSGGATVVTGAGEARLGWSMDLHDVSRALAPAASSATRSHLPLFADVTLVLEDNNPLAELEAHPGKSGNRLDLGGHGEDEWVGALRAAFDVIDRELPAIAAEMRLLLRQVGPVGFYDDVHLSASYLEATGVVYVSLHPGKMTLVEALVHEFQHNKLNLLLAEDPVLVNADHPLFTSPVRPDPRPLRGVLLAVHAFQPLVRLYERLVAKGGPEEPQLRLRLGQIARTCREGCDVLLPNAVPTPRGAPLLEEIAALDRAFAVHLGEPTAGA